MRVTATGNTHDAERFNASVAVHDTSLVPTANVDPDGGEQATLTGDCPPSADGTVYEIVLDVAVVEEAIDAGHDSVGAAGGGGVTTTGGGGVGAVGVPDLQPVTTPRMTTSAYVASRFICGKTP